VSIPVTLTRLEVLQKSLNPLESLANLSHLGIKLLLQVLLDEQRRQRGGEEPEQTDA
jgi:hypothetical protein